MLVATLLLALLPVAPPVEQADAAGASLAGARCADATRRQIESWGGAIGRSLADPPAPDGTRGWRMPTATLGVWVQFSVSPSGDVWLERVSASRRESRRFGSRCEALAGPEAVGGEARENGFTDEELASRLARGDAGVILVWSPHMPLSVDQYDVLASVTRELGLALVAVLDPEADPAYGRRVARERGLPDAVLQPLDGIELAFRGMTTHAPSVQVFADGRLVGPVLYGYRAAETARLAIRGVLTGVSRQVRPPD